MNKYEVLSPLYFLSVSTKSVEEGFDKEDAWKLLDEIFPGLTPQDIEVIGDGVKLMIDIVREGIRMRLMFILQPEKQEDYRFISVSML